MPRRREEGFSETGPQTSFEQARWGGGSTHGSVGGGGRAAASSAQGELQETNPRSSGGCCSPRSSGGCCLGAWWVVG